jgi:hypothetical protein
MNGYTEQDIQNQRYFAESNRSEAEKARVKAYSIMSQELTATGRKIREVAVEVGATFQLSFRSACAAVQLLADEKRKL